MVFICSSFNAVAELEIDLKFYLFIMSLYHLQIVPSSEEDQKAKLQLCSKYLETFTQIKEHEKSFVELSIDLLVGMKDLLSSDSVV